MTGQRWFQGREGASAVEFALVLPILVMLVFGIIQFGIVFGQDLSLSNGARQGARSGAVGQTQCGDIVEEVRNVAAGIAMRPIDVGVEVTGPTGCPTVLAGTGNPMSSVQACEGANPGDRLTVTATFQTSLNIPLVLSQTFDLTSRGVFRCEYS